MVSIFFLFTLLLVVTVNFSAAAFDPNKPIRWGFLGCGRITWDWAGTVSGLPKTEHLVSAFASRNKSRADAYAKEFGTGDNVRSYGSYEELAKDPNIDIIYIGTINPTHYEIAKMLMANGKNILCEKPLTLMMSQAEELVNISRQKNLFFQEADLSRFFPVYSRIKDQLPLIGDIHIVHAQMGQNSYMSQRHVRKELGGGAVKDIGGYVLQFAMFILGSEIPEKIHAVAQLNNESIDHSVSINMQWKDGRIANLFLTVLSSVVSEEAVVYGFSGTIKIPKSFNRPEEFQLILKTETSENKTTEKYPLRNVIDHRTLLSNANGMVYQAQEVRKCLLGGLLESPLITQQDTLNIMAIEDDILKQIGVEYDSLYQNGKWVGSSLNTASDKTDIGH